MPHALHRSVAAAAGLLILVAGLLTAGLAQTGRPVPAFDADPAWPSLPKDWVLGEVTSIAADSRDHVWVLHRPHSIPEDRRAQAAPPVLHFDAAGTLLTSWGGPGDGYEWPEREHGIHVDADGFVWISGNGGWPKPAPGGSTDDMLLKFTPEGKLVLQIGRRGASRGNGDTQNVHQPGDVFVHAATNEVYVADGYGNQRVIVFDATTGAFKRMWGAFGNRPDAPAAAAGPGAAAPVPVGPGPAAAPTGAEGPPQFGLVHAVKVSNDGIVYVADRSNNRIQAFTTDGRYLRQVSIPPAGGVTTVPAGFAFSPDLQQQFLYVVDSGSMRIVVLDRNSLAVLGSVGTRGNGRGEFDIVHHMAADSQGNLYTAEIVNNRRAQKLRLRR